MEQPELLRDYSSDESMFRAAVAAFWSLPARQLQSDEIPGASGARKEVEARPPLACLGHWACCARDRQCCGCCQLSLGGTTQCRCLNPTYGLRSHGSSKCT